jgi:hypothetical protein
MLNELTAERLRSLYTYDAATGHLVSKTTGRPVGWPVKGGHLRCALMSGAKPRKSFFVHRLIWLYVHGSWPAGMLDHINGNKTDNRLENLRDASPAINSQNYRQPTSKNSTGFLGVSKAKGGRFQTSIKVDGRVHWLGRFDDPAEAHAVYVEAKRRHHEGCTL